MRAATVSLAALILAAALVGGCSLDPSARTPAVADQSSSPQLTPVTQTYRDLRGLPEPRGKIVAAVYGFRDQTGQYKQLPDSNFSTAVTQGAASMLVKALLDSRWFVPVEREGLQDLLTERRIIRANEKKENDLPQLLSAQIVLQGGIVAYETNVKTGGAGARYMGIGASDLYRSDQVTVNLRAVDVRSGRVLSSISTTKTIFSVKLEAELFRFVSFKELLEVEVGYTRNEPSQLCVLEAIQAAVVHLVAQGIIDNHWQLRNAGDLDAPVLQTYLREQRLLQTPAPETGEQAPESGPDAAQPGAVAPVPAIRAQGVEARHASTTPDSERTTDRVALVTDASVTPEDAARPNVLRRINFDTAADGSVVLRMTLDRPPHGQPTGFARNNPSQVRFDLPQTRNAVRNVPEVPAALGLVRIQVTQQEVGTRVIIHLATEPNYVMSVDKNVVSAVFGAGAVSASIPGEPPARTAAR